MIYLQFKAKLTLLFSPANLIKLLTFFIFILLSCNSFSQLNIDVLTATIGTGIIGLPSSAFSNFEVAFLKFPNSSNLIATMIDRAS